LRLHRSPASASHDLNQAGGMKENGPANKPHRSCTRETPPIRDEVFEDLEYVRLSRAQTNPSGSVPNSWLVPLFFPTARIRTVTNFLRRNRLLLNRSASIASAYGFFSKYDEVRRDGKGRRTDLFVCGTEQNHLYRRSIDVRSSFGLGPLVRGLPGEEEESSRTGTAQGKKKCLANSACANHLHLESGMTPRRQSIGVSCLHAVWAGI